jgi:hypothetical protein
MGCGCPPLAVNMKYKRALIGSSRSYFDRLYYVYPRQLAAG